MKMHQNCFLFSIRVAFDVTSMKGVTVASEHKGARKHPGRDVELCTPYISFCLVVLSH